jgi:hypothetical protein
MALVDISRIYAPIPEVLVHCIDRNNKVFSLLHSNALVGRVARLVVGRLDGGLLAMRRAVGFAHLGEEEARVEGRQEERGDEHERRVEDEEAGLVLHDVVAPSAGHFNDTISC